MSRTLKIAIAILVVVNVVVLCDAVPQNCTKSVKVTSKSYFGKPKRQTCPGKRNCDLQKHPQAKGHFNPKTERCCFKVITTYENKLTCCNGFEWKNDLKTCTPICKLGCQGGECVDPDVCQCEKPFILQNNRTCVKPECDPPCVNGLCVDTDECECNSSFIKINSTLCVKECGPGQRNDPVTFECVAVCDQPCVNGTCVNGTCECLVGYEEVDRFHCAPKCSTPCQNADCTAPDICTCLTGYTQENATTCTPVCDHECVNGFCEKPNDCHCSPGYTKDDTNIFNCLPFCEKSCVNATCASPNNCTCFNGYESAGNDWSCKPKCVNCDNGDCVEPNKCSCHHGYAWIDGMCQPQCERNCTHGTCSEPETCSCDHGYELDIDDKYTCVPKCDTPCVNGICSAPNNCACLPGYLETENKNACTPNCPNCENGHCDVPNTCICKTGFERKDDTCSPVCTKPCYGKCIAPNVCFCKDGYLNDPKDPSICYKPCDSECVNGKCSFGLCECDTDYKLENGTCVYSPVFCSACVVDESSCISGYCNCTNGSLCVAEPQHATTTAGLAGMELTWVSAGAAVLLLTVLLVIVMQRIYNKKKHYKTNELEGADRYGSVVYNYTVPDSLILKNVDPDPLDHVDEIEECCEVTEDDTREPLHFNDTTSTKSQ